jgi:hypothetical protein
MVGHRTFAPAGLKARQSGIDGELLAQLGIGQGPLAVSEPQPREVEVVGIVLQQLTVRIERSDDACASLPRGRTSDQRAGDDGGEEQHRQRYKCGHDAHRCRSACPCQYRAITQ